MSLTEYRLDGEVAEKLSLYSSLTKIPVHKCIDEAVRNWLDTVAVVRLALIYEEIERRERNARLSPSEKQLVAIVEDENNKQGQSINRNLGLNESARKRDRGRSSNHNKQGQKAVRTIVADE